MGRPATRRFGTPKISQVKDSLIEIVLVEKSAAPPLNFGMVGHPSQMNLKILGGFFAVI